MVLFIGQVASDQRDREAFQEVDYRQMFGPGTLGFAKWVGEVEDADRLPEYVARAFHTAMQGRPGPVVLVLPEDMLTTPTAAPVLPRVEPAQAWPAPGALRELRALLMARGAAVRRSSAAAAGTRRRARRCSASPRAGSCRSAARSASRTCSTTGIRYYAGDVGIGINPKLARAHRARPTWCSRSAPRLGEMTTGGYTLLKAPRPAQKLVHVHAGAEELGRVYAADLMLQCVDGGGGEGARDARAADRAAAGPTGRRGACRLRGEPGGADAVEPLDMAEVVKTIQRLAPADSVLTNGAGNFSGWLHRYYRYPALQQGGRTQLAPTSGAMGYGVPAAVAASLLHPERTVDQHRRRRRLPDDRPGAGDRDRIRRRQGPGRLISIVVDNGTYGTIRMHQEREYPGRVSGSDLFNPDFVALARAYGWRAERSRRPPGSSRRSAPRSRRPQPTLLHLPLAAEVITSRTTISAIRAAARARKQRLERWRGPRRLRAERSRAGGRSRPRRSRRRALAHGRLRVIRHRQADRPHHRQVVGAVADGDRARRLDAEALAGLQQRAASRRRRRCRPRADRPSGR